MKWQDESLREELAAQYVLGTMRGLARKRFERWLMQDRDLQDRTAFWEEALQPLAEQIDPVMPPSTVWDRIRQRLAMVDSPPPADKPIGYAPVTRWWRGAGLSFAIAALLAAILVFGPVEEATQFRPDIEVALENKRAEPVWVVDADSKQGTVVVSAVRNVRLPSDRSLELWLLRDADQPPVSLGLMPIQQGHKYVVQSPSPLEKGVGFAVSLEPEGGSPTGAPTGPVLYVQTYREA